MDSECDQDPSCVKMAAGWWINENAPLNADGEVDWRSDVEMTGSIGKSQEELY